MPPVCSGMWRKNTVMIKTCTGIYIARARRNEHSAGAGSFDF